MNSSLEEGTTTLQTTYGYENQTSNTLNNTMCVNTNHSNDIGTCDDHVFEISASVKTLQDIIGYGIFPVLLVVGVCGNTLTIVVMTSKKFRKMVSRYHLIALAASDSLLLLTQPFNKSFIITILDRDPRAITELGCKAFFVIFRTSKMTSSWFIVSICLERFVAIWFPLKARLICVKHAVLCGIAIIYVGVASFNIGWSFSSLVVGGVCRPDVVTSSTNELYKGFLIVGSSLYSVVPICILLTVTSATVVKLFCYEADRKKLSDYQPPNKKKTEVYRTTTMLLVVMVAYILLISPITCLHNLAFWIGVSVFEHSDESFVVYREIAQVLEQTNYAINFILYVMVSKKFRTGFMETFVKVRSKSIGRRCTRLAILTTPSPPGTDNYINVSLQHM